MKALDLFIEYKKSGNLLTLMPFGDLHLLADSDVEGAYQPLDHDAFLYLRKVMAEVATDNKYYGNSYTLSLADLTELERGGVRKVTKTLRKNDRKAQDVTHKKILRDYIIPKIEVLVRGSKFLGGIAGNHLVEFVDHEEGANSEEYIIKRLGGKYMGEAKGLINFHIGGKGKSQTMIRAVVLHGTKGGSKMAIVKELQKLVYLYGKIDLVIMAHAHDPMAHFHCKYDLPDTADGKIKKHECLVVCIGSTRGGEVMGYDDYTERFNYPASAARFPAIIFHAHMPGNNAGNIQIKLRPIIL